MTDNENAWDKLLNIKTSGRDDTNADLYRYPYEPTPYCVLERLANSSLIRKGDVVLDYGCGKGRVSFFLPYRTKAKTIGIEYDERIYARAVENQKTARANAEFIATRAEKFEVPQDVNRCYFFKPLFRGDSSLGYGKNCRILLHRPKRNVFVFLLSVKRVYVLSCQGR